MNTCPQPLRLSDLIAYALAELSSERETELEEHYMACSWCAARLEFVMEVRATLNAVMHQGLLTASVNAKLVQQALAHGLQVRQYQVHAGQPVACTAAPTDDFVAIRLQVGQQLRSADSVDVNVHWTDVNTDAATQRVVDEVAYDQTTGEVVLLFSGDQVRGFPRSRWVMDAVVHQSTHAERLGPFTLEHTPWEERADGA